MKDEDMPQSIDDCVGQSEKIIYKHYRNVFRENPKYQLYRMDLGELMANKFACRKLRDYRYWTKNIGSYESLRNKEGHRYRAEYDNILLSYLSDPQKLKMLK